MNIKSAYRSVCLQIPLLCLVAMGCSREIPFSEEEEIGKKGQVELLFNTSTGLTTRTQLPGANNVQHVQYVQLYIFDGTAETSACVASENVSWQHAEGAAGGLTTREQRYKVKYAGIEASTTYTFLAVGLDDQSGTTYGLPDAIQKGTTLGAANAALASGKGRTDIATSELFAGFSPMTTTLLGSGTARVDLYRRVAGVMGYFVNIPKAIGGTEVASLRIELYKIQNGSVPLLKRAVNDFIMLPMSASDTDKVVVNIPAIEFAASGDTTSKGSYVLPIIAPFATQAAATAAGYNPDAAALLVKDYTLCVVLADASGKALRTQKVKKKSADSSETTGGTGIIISSDAYRFPIIANHFYSIGSADSPIDLGEEEGNIVITVNPKWDWEGELEWQ